MYAQNRAGPARSALALALVMLTLMGVAGILLAPVNPAHAHASLVRAEPADGSVVAAAPKAFALVFSEPTSPLVLKLAKPDGTSVTLDRFVLRDTTLDIEAPADLGDGTYVLSWRIVSEDGHPVGGSAVFSIGAPGAVQAHASEPVDWPVRGAVWVAKVALYAGLFIGAGGAFFIGWVGGETQTARRAALWGLAAGLVATPLSVGVQGLDALGRPLTDLGATEAWVAGFSTSYGLTALLAFGALGLAAVSLAIAAGTTRRVLTLIALVAAGLALAASGHASAAQPQWLTRPAVFLHGVGIAFWAGSLVPLAAAFGLRDGNGAAALRRFSLIIPVAVVALVAAGGVLAVIQLRSVEALWTTDYGKLLLIKLALLAALFLLAAVNRFNLTGPALRGEVTAIRRLRRSIGVELVLVLAIFAVAAGWRFTPPPRSLAEAAAAPAFLHIHGEKAMADVTITPGRAGRVRAEIAVQTGEFTPLDAKGVTLVLSNPAAGIEQIRRPAARSGEGTWSVESLDLPLPGQWQVRIDILISDFEMTRLSDVVEIRP